MHLCRQAQQTARTCMWSILPDYLMICISVDRPSAGLHACGRLSPISHEFFFVCVCVCVCVHFCRQAQQPGITHSSRRVAGERPWTLLHVGPVILFAILFACLAAFNSSAWGHWPMAPATVAPVPVAQVPAPASPAAPASPGPPLFPGSTLEPTPAPASPGRVPDAASRPAASGETIADLIMVGWRCNGGVGRVPMECF